MLWIFQARYATLNSFIIACIRNLPRGGSKRADITLKKNVLIRESWRPSSRRQLAQLFSSFKLVQKWIAVISQESIPPSNFDIISIMASSTSRLIINNGDTLSNCSRQDARLRGKLYGITLQAAMQQQLRQRDLSTIDTSKSIRLLRNRRPVMKSRPGSCLPE